MRRQLIGTLVVALQLGAAAMANVGAAVELKPGDPAPDFSLIGTDGRTYHLAEFKGKRAVVLAWYPKAFTGG